MDLKALHYFVTVVECGGLTSAAERLRIAQPSLGWQIRKLEEELEVELIVRHSRGVEPTNAGLLLAEHARDILARTNFAIAQVRELAKEPRGTIEIGMTASVRNLLAVPLLQALATKAPQLNVNIVEEFSAVLVEWVTSGRIDVALTYAMPEAQGLRGEALAGEVLYFIDGGRPGSSAGKTIAFAKAAGHPLVMPTTSSRHRTFLEQMAKAKGGRLDVVRQLQSIATIRDLVEQGAATILPYGVLAREIESGSVRARRIVDPEMMLDVYLYHLEIRPLSPSARIVRGVIARLVRETIAASPHVWRPIDRPADGMSRIHSSVAMLARAL